MFYGSLKWVELKGESNSECLKNAGTATTCCHRDNIRVLG